MHSVADTRPLNEMGWFPSLTLFDGIQATLKDIKDSPVNIDTQKKYL